MSKPPLNTAFHANPLVNQIVVTLHRVGLQSSILGRTFRSGKTGLVRSKMNPKQHIVWGVPIMTRASRAAVAELAFDIEYSNLLPSEIFLGSLWRRSEKPIRDVLEALPQTGMALGDELLLHVPVTPSHFVIQWDITSSTQIVATNYPVFKHFLQTFMLAIEAELDTEQTTVRFMGDGQMIALSMNTIDQLDPQAVKKYGNTVALRLARTILRLHKAIAKRYSNIMELKVRIALGLGHLDYIQMTEPTGPILWEVADLLRRAARQSNSLLLTEHAKNALQLR